MSRSRIGWIGLALLSLCLASVVFASPSLEIAETTTEYAVNPTGIDTQKPRFGWVLSSETRGQMQSAYQILVASSKANLAKDQGDKWDSGKVTSAESVSIEYAGKALTSAECCFWKVRCWDKDGQPSAWSYIATFEMGLLEPSDWQGKWIGPGHNEGPPDYVAGKFGQGIYMLGDALAHIATGATQPIPSTHAPTLGHDQTIRIPNDPHLKPEKTITISAWIRPGDPNAQGGGGRGPRSIYRKEDGDSRHALILERLEDSDKLRAGFGIGSKYIECSGELSPANRFWNNAWHLVTTTYDGSAIKLFVDGDEIGQEAASGRLDSMGDAPVFIGSNSGESEFYRGGIDDVRIYARALSQQEIRTLMSEGNGSDERLVGWWNFDGDLSSSVGGKAAEAGGYQGPAPLLRKSFHLDKQVAQATCYISGIGWNELYINGKRVGNNVLDPAPTDYDKRVFYVTHDVTDLLQSGNNAMGVMLGHGWYSEQPGPNYGDSPRLRLQMNIRFADGTRTSIVSDESWKMTDGPIRKNSMTEGEMYDARLEKAGWTQADYVDADWSPVQSAPEPGGVMESQKLPPMKVNVRFKPVKILSPAQGVFVYELPQLFAGWSRIHLKGPAGTKITIRYGARFDPQTGRLADRRHPEPGATDYYILKGDLAGEVYEPRFTFHPVRYVQVEGYPGTLTLDDLEGCAVHSDVDLSGSFACSNALFTQIHRNATWTFRNDVFGMQMDCIYREPWAWLEPGTNPSMLANRKNMATFWEKYLRDASFAQHPDGVVPDVIPNHPRKGRYTGEVAWAGNYPIVAWNVYQYFDDRRVIEEHYPFMKKWMEHLIATADGDLYSTGYYGDHMLPGPEPGKEEFLSSETPKELVRSAFYYKDAFILTRAAELLGKTDDAKRYGDLAAKIRDAFNAKWFDPNTCQYATGSQTADLIGLTMDIVPEGSRAKLLVNIAQSLHDKGHFHTGNVGTAMLMEAALPDLGHGQVIYDIMNKTTYPGFGYMVARGATTLWEAWDVYANLWCGEESMNMNGVIQEFFYRDLAGIGSPTYYGPEMAKTGFREIEIRPHVLGDLKWVKGSNQTVRGMISSDWRIENGMFTLTVSIPVNSVAHISVPTFGKPDAVIHEGKDVAWNGSYHPGIEGISGAKIAGEYVTFDAGSGTYTFTVPASK